jgi:hypothetical protein
MHSVFHGVHCTIFPYINIVTDESVVTRISLKNKNCEKIRSAKISFIWLKYRYNNTKDEKYENKYYFSYITIIQVYRSIHEHINLYPSNYIALNVVWKFA